MCGDVETNPGPPKENVTLDKSQCKRNAGTQDLGDQSGERTTLPRRYKKIKLQDSGQYMYTASITR
ncbi:hypothetical protein DPMN_078315 [Dreissena polymorpha]|uniref:Uncharacterized protein n=1 Tax=Dreissena polymorpha TaxID=45954 RepID=A0A9D3YQA9_DREPO|nr:hypothetical protein DPMN_078315 [Dreissena polymorpha]